MAAQVESQQEVEAAPMRAQPPVQWRELGALLLLVVLADLTLYRAYGFAGYAAFFLIAPLLLWIGSPRPRLGRAFWLLAIMVVLLVAKLLWCGSWLLVGCGFALVVGLAMALAGLPPYVLEAGVFASQTVLAGYEGLVHYRRSADQLGHMANPRLGLSFFLPLVIFLAFALLFVVANPDELAMLGDWLARAVTTLHDWILSIAPTWLEVVIWLVVAWLGIGLLRPVMDKVATAATARKVGPAGPAMLYAPWRNTLITVIVLFAAYLAFEFYTLWFREIPENFHYSGYAHEGAAWLTVALALATVVLSLIFRGRMLADDRLPRLRRLAWIWSLENLLLAVAVYHRLFIYVGFNGMTRMRVVGLFGMTCVVVGFVLVVWKILRGHDFLWLVRHQLWALALAVFLFALTPVDPLVHRYNVDRILAGDPVPSVQISVHPIDASGVPVLLPLTECDDPIIRDGVRAMLATRLDEAEQRAQQNEKHGWTTYQLADRQLLDRLEATRADWDRFENLSDREAALERFHKYAYQWF
ncbi:MAG: DUF4173 domain-containing protein [Pirellulales bacterium]|nr:DUF4173 domain-containing protein [Pirellulales bacterium]